MSFSEPQAPASGWPTMPVVLPNLTTDTLRLSSSTSVSRPAAPRITPSAAETTSAVSSSVLPTSALATGASFWPPTSSVTVAVSVFSPSVMV